MKDDAVKITNKDINRLRKMVIDNKLDKSFLISLDNLEKLLIDAPTYFAPQYNFDGDKRKWFQKAGLIPEEKYVPHRKQVKKSGGMEL
jgi:hypothetical protein